ncbi:transposase, partial [Streptomyces sp. NPDC005077]|uniref:transposase n=1 Tax=Streptomyces sp. NPDC005077 TaxID=3154292 RepID=UPI0033A847F8
QFFLSESTWDHEQVNARRLELLLADPATAPHPGGVLVIDDSGDRKDGKATAHIGRQWIGRLGAAVPRESPLRPAGTGTQRARGGFPPYDARRGPPGSCVTISTINSIDFRWCAGPAYTHTLSNVMPWSRL